MIGKVIENISKRYVVFPQFKEQLHHEQKSITLIVCTANEQLHHKQLSVTQIIQQNKENLSHKNRRSVAVDRTNEKEKQQSKTTTTLPKAQSTYNTVTYGTNQNNNNNFNKPSKNMNNQNIREHTKKKDQNSIAIFATSMVKHLNNWQVPKTLDHSNCKIYVKHISGAEAVCMQDNQNHDCKINQITLF